MTKKTFYEAEQCNTVQRIKSMLVYQTKYRSQSAQFKLFRSANVLTHFCESC